MNLKDFFCRLDEHVERVPLDELTALVRQVEFEPEEIEDYLQFSQSTYQRNLVKEGPAYQVLMLCWLNGQRSPIHDHVGSSCAVRVVQGVALETIFEQAPNGMIYATRSFEHRQGAVCGSQDADKHQVSNLQAGDAPLVTMHVYSPPLLKMNRYSLTDAAVHEFTEPINILMFGAGI